MYCRNCGEYISDDMLFCPKCGLQLQQPKKVCYYCKTPLKDDETICPSCGKNQNDFKKINNDPYKGYWKKPILWIILVALMAGSTFIGNYISNHPINNAERKETTVKMSGTMLEESVYANNQNGGYAIIDKQNIYVVQGEKLYSAALTEPSLMEEMIDDCVGYLSIDGDKLYYCDKYYDYYSYDLKTKEKTKLLENIYYPVVVDNQLYYQLDDDNESLHCLNLSTKEDKKYNDSTTYHITLDKENKKIYYINYVDDEYSLHCVNLDGSDDEKIRDTQNGSFVLDDDYIYLCDEMSIIKINKKDKKETILKENDYFYGINICDDKLVFHSINTVYVMSKDGKIEKEIYNGMIKNFQAVGHNIVLKSYDESYNQTICILDLDGNSIELLDNVKGV